MLGVSASVGEVGGKVFIVDWDIPSDKVYRRQKFYRELKRYLNREKLPLGWSTSSVVKTLDLDFACYIKALAESVGGISNLYEAKILDWEKLRSRVKEL